MKIKRKENRKGREIKREPSRTWVINFSPSTLRTALAHSIPSPRPCSTLAQHAYWIIVSSILLQIKNKIMHKLFMYYLLPTTNFLKSTEFVSKFIPNFIFIIWENIGWIWDLSFMNLYKINVKSNNTSLDSRLYILCIHNQRKTIKI
jgi:hypothetical protein